MRAGSNPGGIGHDWVYRRFVDERSRASDCVFVPARLEDNPSVDESYAASLAKLDPIVRKQLEDGDWIRDGGGLVYGQFRESLNCVDVAPELDTVMLGLDFGIKDQNAATVLGWRAYDTCIYVLESYRKTMQVHECSAEVAMLERKYRFASIIGDIGGMGKAFQGDLHSRYGIPMVGADKHNKVGYISMFNSDLARGRVKVVSSTCRELLQEWRELPWNELRTKEVEGFDNHAADSCLYVWRAAYAYLETEAPERPPEIGSPAFYAQQQERLLSSMQSQWERRKQEEADPYA
jgi:phage terminase large subunit-like protein